jgi:hypothetical protein
LLVCECVAPVSRSGPVKDGPRAFHTRTSTDTTPAGLIDGSLGEGGLTAMVFAAPIAVDGGSWTLPGVQFTP